MRIVIALLLTGLLVARSHAADALRIDDAMDHDPELPALKLVSRFDPRLRELWLWALSQHDSELQRLAADTIGIAHQRGMPGMRSTADELLKLAQQSSAVPTVRRAAVHTLVVLEAREFAAELAELATKHGLDLALVVEPALGRWEYPLIREVWRRRLDDPHLLPRFKLLAIEGLGNVRDEPAKAGLLRLVRDRQESAQVRLAAAEALAAIGGGGVLEEVRQLLAAPSSHGRTNRLLAARLLAAQHDDAAVGMLQALATDPEPAIAAAAWQQLNAVHPRLTYSLAPQAIASTDATVRREAARSLLHRADSQAIETLTPLLGDLNPSLRRFVGKSLFDLASKPERQPSVVRVVEQALAGTDWRGLEQAALVAGYLDHKPAAARLLELLQHSRTEVAVSAAWALRKLKVPQTIPALLEYADVLHRQLASGSGPARDTARALGQLPQLLQLFGELRLAEADELLRRHVAKNVNLGQSRTAACWALGKLHEGQAIPELVRQFRERLADVDSLPPELESVRRMCAIGLGRMQAATEVDSLRQFANLHGEAGLACWWSLESLTKQPRPVLVPDQQNILGWFLEPIVP